jgi:Protein adenylyltransferase SelO
MKPTSHQMVARDESRVRRTLAARGDLDAIRCLADHVIARHYPEAVDAANRYRTVLDLVISRQAALIAQWLRFLYDIAAEVSGVQDEHRKRGDGGAGDSNDPSARRCDDRRGCSLRRRHHPWHPRSDSEPKSNAT